MFPDSHIANDYSLRPQKLSYVVSHGTSYYFNNELIKDVRKAHGFLLLFDETTIVGVRKQLDIFFRYWTATGNCVCVRYYKSIFLGRATADVVSRSIVDSLRADGINITRMLMLGRDNPNVNKCLLSLSHGNSDVEWGFLQNNHLVTDERSSLNEASINGLRATNAGIKFFGDSKVPITNSLLFSVQQSYSRYAKDNDRQQKLVKNVDTEQKQLQEDLAKATNLLEEGSKRLAAAINNKTFDDLSTAEVLVTATNTKLAALKTQLIVNSENLNRLRKKTRKNEIIYDLINII
ncbi:unnamed protein product [Rotaria socialis]